MTLDDILIASLEELSASGETLFLGWETVQRWPTGSLDRMRETGILTTATPAQMIECHGCANRCFMEVQELPGSDPQSARYFVVCDDPEMQSQMGTIHVPSERLQQWKVTALQLAKVTADLLDIDSQAEDRHGRSNIRVGMLRGRKGRRWLSLNKSPLTLELNDHLLPLEEMLFFEKSQLAIDRSRIDQLIDSPPKRRAKPYTPDIDKREAGKRKTEAMHEDWRQEYLRLRRKHPNQVSHSDNWISRQIAKQNIAQGRSPETIRKNMA